MPKQGKKYNFLEQKNEEVKYRMGDMLQHSKGFRKRKNLVGLQPTGLRNIGYLYAFIPNGFNTEIGSVFIM